MTGTKLLWLTMTCLLGSLAAQAQRSDNATPMGAISSSAVVPRLIRFSGIVKGELNQAQPSVVGINFSLYKEPEGRAAL